MRRVPIALALAMTLILGIGLAPTMAANKHEPAGDRISLLDGDQSFPANTAFHINHGFCVESSDTPKTIGRLRFDLDVDGVPQGANFFDIERADGCTVVKFWYFNFPAGMTGTHVFTGHWYAPCDNDAVPCGGAKLHTVVDDGSLSITVDFT